MTGKGFQQPISEVNAKVEPVIDSKKTKEEIKEAIFKNVGFVNRKWAEILVEDEEKCEQLESEEVKKGIIQLSKRELHDPIDEWIDKCIRVKHKTCAGRGQQGPQWTHDIYPTQADKQARNQL